MSGDIYAEPADNDGNDKHSQQRWRLPQLEKCPIATVPISSLAESDSPRLAGENVEHTRLLAESDAELPPIIVHRNTMRVIDGTHRLRAAMLHGRDTIDVRFFDGTDADAFVLAVEANTAHGLPLSMADRSAAAERILGSHPQWSDRAIAAATGLTAKTIAAIRQRSTADIPQSNSRIGRDGRVRPLNAMAGRRLAGELIAANPDASVREIAKSAGVSPATVHDVRKRLRSGEEPVPAKRRKSAKTPKSESSTSDRENSPAEPIRILDQASTLEGLKKDPSLRFNDAGRSLLRWLNSVPIDKDEQQYLIDNMPAHCTHVIAELARQNATALRTFADQLEMRGYASSG